MLKQDQLNQHVSDYHSEELRVTYRIFQERGMFPIRVGCNPKVPMQTVRLDEFSTSYSMSFLRNEKEQIAGFELNDVGAQKSNLSKRLGD